MYCEQYVLDEPFCEWLQVCVYSWALMKFARTSYIILKTTCELDHKLPADLAHPICDQGLKPQSHLSYDHFMWVCNRYFGAIACDKKEC